MTPPTELDRLLDRITRHRFRAKFHLRGRDRATVELRGYVVDVIGRWIERELAVEVVNR